ncbi:putative bifunctional diguanylate cyclase/phosphodiesterase [Sphingomicrobium clamense]|uniref:EAL domain-containing protein n=1 Tax=Sphingomicrobium clamense TaxID=2851013 RepID=A0ABS6V7F9_9SPHN|nr:EAL domain-containing protein [Sphingomicrobium sp. B8]MBW0145517.1 EAL domain-containing protein [Sphingomicrobium sp. B8]
MQVERFHGASSQQDEAVPSTGDAWLFDLRAPDSFADREVARLRLAQVRHIPLFMILSHLLAAGVLVASLGMAIEPTIVAMFGGLLALDISACLMMRFRKRVGLRSHHIHRIMVGFALVTTALWCLTGFAVSELDALKATPIPEFIVGVGVLALVIAAMAGPMLTVAIGVTSTLTAMYVNMPIYISMGIATVTLLVGLVSVTSSRNLLRSARRRQQLEADARKALQFINEYETSGQGWFWETDAAGLLTYVSDQLAEDVGCEAKTLVGRKLTEILRIDKKIDGSETEDRTLGFHLSARFPFSDVVVRPVANDDVHWSMSGNPIYDQENRFLGFRGLGSDLTEKRRTEQEISRLARFDSLTGLPNRAKMRQTLEEALRSGQRRGRGCTLFLIDLDRFKNVNDTLGHPTGDALLREVGARLTSVLGEHGQVGRLGGDEFKAVLPRLTETGLLESIARNMISEVSKPYIIEGHRVTIGTSIGIAVGDPGRGCADSMIRNADLALYAAKAAGRGCHAFFEPSMHSEATDRQRLENDLRGAVERNDLHVVFQPIVRAASENVCGFEALVRWDHPARGAISPEKFISVAEECGLIGKIGEFVLDRSVEQAKLWPENVRVAVNLSPIQFNDPRIVDIVANTLERHKLRADRLELEITEGVFLAESEETDDTFARLKELGVRLALDDFGTGYSSLGYLKTAPFDKIKIDQSFVKGLRETGDRNHAIVRAIVTLAESLGMDTTAEGIETHDTLEAIRALGVSQVQGFIFGKPLPAEEAERVAHRQIAVPEGHAANREKRHRLMRRAVTAIDGEATEIRLRNISAKGALVECTRPVAPGTVLAIDIVGVGPVVGTVRWSQANRFGVQFDDVFDLARLTATKQEVKPTAPSMKPWYLEQPTGSEG